MKLETTGDRIEVKDNPIGFWIFYSIFVIGGSLVVLMMFSESVKGIRLVFGMLIGVGNILGGLLMFKREPASFVVVDRATNEVRVRRWGLVGRSVNRFPLERVERASVERSDHVDGGAIFRPTLLLNEGCDPVPISRFWYQSEGASRRVVDEINRFLGKQGGANHDVPSGLRHV